MLACFQVCTDLTLFFLLLLPPHSSSTPSSALLNTHITGTDMGGIKDPNKIVEKYLYNETELFDYFREAERVHEKIRMESNQLRLITEKYDHMTKQQMAANSSLQSKLLQINQKIQRTKDKDMIQKKILKNIKKIFNKICTKISTTFSALGCDEMDDPSGMGRSGRSQRQSSSSGGHHSSNHTASMRQYLGATVAENNILKYMGVLEAKTVDVISKYKLLLEREGVDMKQYGTHMIGMGVFFLFLLLVL